MEWGRSSVPAKRGCLLHCRTGRGAARLAGFGCCGPWLPRCCHSRFRGNDDPVPSRSVPSDVFLSDTPMTDPRPDETCRNSHGLDRNRTGEGTGGCGRVNKGGGGRKKKKK